MRRPSPFLGPSDDFDLQPYLPVERREQSRVERTLLATKLLLAQ